MVAVQILIFGEVAGFKIVPFIATHVKMKIFFHGVIKKKEKKKKNSANQNSPICMKTTDIKLLLNESYSHIEKLLWTAWIEMIRHRTCSLILDPHCPLFIIKLKKSNSCI